MLSATSFCPPKVPPTEVGALLFEEGEDEPIVDEKADFLRRPIDGIHVERRFGIGDAAAIDLVGANGVVVGPGVNRAADHTSGSKPTYSMMSISPLWGQYCSPYVSPLAGIKIAGQVPEPEGSLARTSKRPFSRRRAVRQSMSGSYWITVLIPGHSGHQ